MPRLTPEATGELAVLEGKLSQVMLCDVWDLRHSPFADEDGKLHTKDLYALLKCIGASANSSFGTFWSSCAPPRVQFFAWLLVHEKIQCKTNLVRRKILLEDTCELCGRCPESAMHLLFHCDFAASFWWALGFVIPADLEARSIRQLPRPAHVERNHYDTFLLLCCWGCGNAGTVPPSGRRRRLCGKLCMLVNVRRSLDAAVFLVPIGI